ncbi:MAG: hypothetical protein ABSF23_08075, partial [Terracidiphilus sp.]
MNCRRRMLLALVAALFLLLSAPVLSAAWSSSQQKLRSGKFHVHSACMMPPRALVVRFGFKGAKELPAEGDNWAKALEAFVETHLKVSGITIMQASDPLSSGASDDELRQVLFQIEEKFNAVSKQLGRKPGEVAKAAYTLGDQAAMLPCSADSDLLVFVRGVDNTPPGLMSGGP